MDFVQDGLANGRMLRILTVEDTLHAGGTGHYGGHVHSRATRAAGTGPADCHTRPEEIWWTNGPKMIGRAVTSWCEEHHVLLRPIEPGKPSQNGHIESFNRRFRNECLNVS
jgi:putative transposase